MKENIRIIEYTLTVGCTDIDYVAMFNKLVISDKEVSKLINSGMVEYDDRVVVMYKKQYEYLTLKQ